MIRINQLKLKVNHNESELLGHIAKQLRITESEILKYNIIKKSIDARKKNDIYFNYSVEVQTNKDKAIVKRLNKADIILSERNIYSYVPKGTIPLNHRPVVVGMGPAGLFSALMLARNGYKPIVIERGKEVKERVKDVETFWDKGILDLNSNVQFGEGGAGTFSDGKLNTLVKDEHGRNREVLETFVKHGAPAEVLYLNKPHIGTDMLRDVVQGIREEIISLGGEVRFNTTLTKFVIRDEKLIGIELNHDELLDCDTVVLAVGHSARDTFDVILKQGLDITSKAFAIGLRIEHKQELIGKSQYGDMYDKLPTADYKLTYKASTGRGVYSFCMCPGGFVVNSSSEEGRLVVNGMSNHARDEENANSAIIVTVNPSDYGDELDPLAGVKFQKHLEEMAYKEGNGSVPVQLYKDLLSNKESDTIGHIIPNIKGKYKLANLNNCLPDYVTQTIIEGIEAFNKMIPGYSDGDAVLSGVESRTSSPIRILRDECYESNIRGIYPCGEGAGYAGGITSAAMDGIKVFEAIANKYKAN